MHRLSESDNRFIYGHVSGHPILYLLFANLVDLSQSIPIL